MVSSSKLPLFLLVGASLLVGAEGCSGNSSAVPCTSELLIQLEVTTDVEGLDLGIDEVSWVISGNDMAPMTGVLDTSDSRRNQMNCRLFDSHRLHYLRQVITAG
jgi:hypothetical protein